MCVRVKCVDIGDGGTVFYLCVFYNHDGDGVLIISQASSACLTFGL